MGKSMKSKLSEPQIKQYRPPMHRRITETYSMTSMKHLGLQKMNQYTIIKKIGNGQYGEVFLCNNGEKNFAMKVLKRPESVSPCSLS
jgi:serine/threonine protein kinase